MKKLIFSFALNFAVLNCVGMQTQQPIISGQPLQIWVQNANQVNIGNLKLNTSITISNTTTIADLKNYLQDSEGIPQNQQLIRARWASWWIFTHDSGALADTQNVKQAMNHFNTSTLALSLTLIRASAANSSTN